jgi:hypothetical protein
MTAHLPPNHDAHDADKDALNWCRVRLGAKPPIPPDVRASGDPHRIISAALAQLRTLSVRGGMSFYSNACPEPREAKQKITRITSAHNFYT